MSDPMLTAMVNFSIDLHSRIKELEAQVQQLLAYVRDQPCECHDEYGKPKSWPCDRCVLLQQDGRKP